MKDSTIITSNRSVKDWVQIFAGDEMPATAAWIVFYAPIDTLDSRMHSQ